MPTMTTRAARQAPPASLTMNFGGVEFALSPANSAAQVSYRTNSQGQIVLDLQNFSGTLQVSVAGNHKNTTAPPATRSLTKVEEEPHSPELPHFLKSTEVSPGQQRISFPVKRAANKGRKLSNDGSSGTSAKKSRSMETPTQNVPDLSQTMHTTTTSGRSTQEGSHHHNDRVSDDDLPPKETVQEILDRVNNSSDSVMTARDPDETNDFTMIVEESPKRSSVRPNQTQRNATTEENSTAIDHTTTDCDYKSPCPRWGHTMTKLKDGRLLIYGGQSFDLQGNPVILSDVHIYNPSKRTWDKPINCRGEARQWHSATFLPERQLLLAFGGETLDALGKKKDKVVTSDSLTVLDTEIMLWYPPAVSGDVPTGRSGHTATLIPSTNEVVLFGGVKGSKWLNAVSVLDTVRWVWTTPKIQGSAPKPRSYHTATVVNGVAEGHYRIVMFGGNNKTSCFNTVPVLEMVTTPKETVWKWSHPSILGQPPFPRTGHSATLLDDGKTICIYGGWDPNEENGNDDDDDGEENIFKSCFLLDTETWTWSQGPKAFPAGNGTDEGPAVPDCGAKRCGHTSTVHPETGEVILFGGRIPGEVLAGDFQRLSNGD